MSDLKMPRPLDGSAIAVLTVCCLIWGLGLSVVKIANTGLSPIWHAGLRSLFAAIVLLIWAKARGIEILKRDGTFSVGLLAGGIFSLEFLTLYVGLNGTTAARGTVFLHAAPFVAAAGEHYLVPGHRLTGIRLAGLVAAFAGLLLALAEPLMQGGGGTLWGDALCLIAGICWGLITIVTKTTRFGAIAAERGVLYQLAVSAVVLLGVAPLVEPVRMVWTTPVALGFAYTVLLTVAFGYTVWFWMMRRYSAASLHAFTFLTPIFGVVGSTWLLGETVGLLTLCGLVLVALGIYLVNRVPRAPVTAP